MRLDGCTCNGIGATGSHRPPCAWAARHHPLTAAESLDFIGDYERHREEAIEMAAEVMTAAADDDDEEGP